MMRDKWVQAAIVGGAAIGFFLATWIGLIGPIINLGIAGVLGVFAVLLTARARG